jgi:hypothetical protein
MYMSQMPHFLDDKGNIPTEMPKQARELASFMALVVDTTTKTLPAKLTSTDILCFNKGCHGWIKSEVLKPNNEIHWVCSKCQNEVRFTEWQKTKWDNRVFHK